MLLQQQMEAAVFVLPTVIIGVLPRTVTATLGSRASTVTTINTTISTTYAMCVPFGLFNYLPRDICTIMFMC